MSEWLLLVLAAIAGSLISLLGGLYLIYGKKGVKTLQQYAVPFAAGALLAAAFLDLLPEAIEASTADTVLMAVLVGFVTFFVLERSLSWFHHHHDHADEPMAGRRNTSLIVIGDTMHNFIDGIAIGAAFLVSPATGLITTAAIAAHEIPQEIGDFGLLLAKGMRKKRVVLVNIVSAFATVIAAVLVYGLGGSLPINEGVLLGLTAGFFIYIAASDIVPTIHAEPKRRIANIQTAVLLASIVFVGVASSYAHGFAPHDPHNDYEETTSGQVEHSEAEEQHEELENKE